MPLIRRSPFLQVYFTSQLNNLSLIIVYFILDPSQHRHAITFEAERRPGLYPVNIRSISDLLSIIDFRAYYRDYPVDFDSDIRLVYAIICVLKL